MSDAIGDALDIAPIPSAEKPAALDVVANTSVVASGDDMAIASENLKSLIGKGNQALDQIMEVAELSQHPRAYEVVATTLSTLALINKQLVDTAKARKEVPNKGSSINNANNVQQNVFVGSTAELAKFLEMKNGRTG